jgi:glycosyltransferase involved in cell wall biosynthesis
MQLVVDGIIYHKQAHGGISRIYSEILPRMCALEPSLRVDLITTAHPPLKQTPPQHPQIKQRRIPTVKFGNATLLNKMIRNGSQWAITGTGKGKIWHSTYFSQPRFWRGKLVATVYDLAQVFSPESFPNSNLDRFQRWQKRHIQSADIVICISERTQRDVTNIYGIDLSRTQHIPLSTSNQFNLLPAEQSEPQPSIPSPFILYVGSRAPYKNFDRLLQAYNQWKRKREVALVVVGPPWTIEEEQILADLNIQDNVNLQSGVDDNMLCQFYNQAAAFIYPSLYEGFGIPLLEAMACGCPVVASRIPTSEEVAGTVPIYFEPKSVEDLTDALDRALTEGRVSERTQIGLEHVKQYSWDRTAQETLAVYEALS